VIGSTPTRGGSSEAERWGERSMRKPARSFSLELMLVYIIPAT
jgi:hypothetical protein